MLRQDEADALKKMKIPHGTELRTSKLDSPLFHGLFTPEFKQLSEYFKEKDYELRVSGGAVRDLLMDIKPADVDFATTATPVQMRDMFDSAQVRMFNKNGEAHGTITVYINEKEVFEITTLRVDIVCDGRRANVSYTTDWELDAFRRDLTINSLFLGLDGTVYDYTGGIEDVQARRVRFVGDAVERLREDYLRILRYFRFFGRIAAKPDQHESSCIEAIIACREGMKNITGERIWMEFHKILVGRFASPVLKTMFKECQLNELLGLPPAPNLDEFQRVAEANLKADNGKLAIEPCTALAALLSSVEELDCFHQRVKLSNSERRLGEFLIEHRQELRQKMAEGGEQMDKGVLRILKHFVLDTIFEWGVDLKETATKHCEEMLKYVSAPEPLRQQFNDWVQQGVEKFPVNGIDLKNAGVPPGKSYKLHLAYLFRLWKQSDLTASKEELLKHLGDTLPDDIDTSKIKRKRRYSPPKIANSVGTT